MPAPFLDHLRDLSIVSNPVWKEFEKNSISLRQNSIFFQQCLLPSDFNPTSKYPLIDVVTDKKIPLSFFNALAECGFIVCCTQLKEEEIFNPAGWMKRKRYGLNFLSKIKPYLDLNRLGIMGVGKGSLHALYACCTFPEIYKSYLLYLDRTPEQLLKKYRALISFHRAFSFEKEILQNMLIVAPSNVKNETLNLLIKWNIDFRLWIINHKKFFEEQSSIKKIWDFYSAIPSR